MRERGVLREQLCCIGGRALFDGSLGEVQHRVRQPMAERINQIR
jgi:hypothetical protein